MLHHCYGRERRQCRTACSVAIFPFLWLDFIYLYGDAKLTIPFSFNFLWVFDCFSRVKIDAFFPLSFCNRITFTAALYRSPSFFLAIFSPCERFRHLCWPLRPIIWSVSVAHSFRWRILHYLFYGRTMLMCWQQINKFLRSWTIILKIINLELFVLIRFFVHSLTIWLVVIANQISRCDQLEHNSKSSRTQWLWHSDFDKCTQSIFDENKLRLALASCRWWCLRKESNGCRNDMQSIPTICLRYDGKEITSNWTTSGIAYASQPATLINIAAAYSLAVIDIGTSLSYPMLMCAEKQVLFLFRAMFCCGICMCYVTLNTFILSFYEIFRRWAGWCAFQSVWFPFNLMQKQEAPPNTYRSRIKGKLV